jgi:hypothetical protein
MGIRLFALVRQTKAPPRVKHYQGLPPDLGAEEEQQRTLLPWPRVLLVEEKPDGIFLFRFSQDGRFGGDTWHMSIQDAKAQAEYEYGDALGEWKQVPQEIVDPVAFALNATT